MITELISMLSSPVFWLTLVVWTALPYGMFLVAYLFEGRRIGKGPNDVPLWKDQSRAFVPGDFGLALFVTVALYYYAQGVTTSWSQSWWYLAVCVLFTTALYVSVRRFAYTPRHYTPDAWRSPSKRYHDYVVFLLFASVAARFCVPFYFATTWTDNTLSRLFGLFGLSLWILGNVCDFMSDETPNRRQHPDTYQPVWRRSVVAN